MSQKSVEQITSNHGYPTTVVSSQERDSMIQFPVVDEELLAKVWDEQFRLMREEPAAYFEKVREDEKLAPLSREDMWELSH